jgi:hypothetical protein
MPSDFEELWVLAFGTSFRIKINGIVKVALDVIASVAKQSLQM